MATTPTPAPNPVVDLLQQAISTGLKINIAGTLPGEALMEKLFDAYIKTRETMDPDIRKRWDAIFVQWGEDAQAVWRGLWVKVGVLR